MLRIVSYHNHFGPLTAQTVELLDEVVRDTAQEVRRRAAQMAPVDTEALRESLYVSDDRRSDYQERADEAEARRHEGNRPGSPAQIVPEVRPPAPHAAIVGAAVAHGLPNEFGTTRMPARPFLRPAIAAVAADFKRDVNEALAGRGKQKGNLTGAQVHTEVGEESSALALGEGSVPAIAGEAAELAVLL